jgi:DNA-binding LacI/PurR family transcriptional regulator
MDLHENNQSPDLRCLPSLCRGIYNRVAQKVGCDPSYVSRVARGERTSEAVSEALRAEIQLAWAKINEGFPEVTGRATKRKARASAA